MPKNKVFGQAVGGYIACMCLKHFLPQNSSRWKQRKYSNRLSVKCSQDSLFSVRDNNFIKFNNAVHGDRRRAWHFL